MEFFTSDTHFGHANIIKYCNRPYKDAEEMDRKMIENWNDQVSDTDHVYHMGDFAYGSKEYIAGILRRLNGIKHFVFGNHDKTIKQNVKYFKDNNLFATMEEAIEINVKTPEGNAFITMHHYGRRVWNKSHRGSLCLFGHSHGTLTPLGKSVDVGVDATFITGKPEYRPFSSIEIIRYMKTREQCKEDYH